MKFIALVFKNARRSKRRTALTVISVALAVFLFASLRAILDGFNAGAEASSSTRIVTIRSTSLMFTIPISYAQTIQGIAGVRDVTWASWFGGIYKDPNNFFAQFAVDPESYLRMYPEIELPDDQRRAFLEDRTGAIVGEGLADRYGFTIGSKIVLQVTIPLYGARDYDFTVRGIYKSTGAAVDNQTMLFHWKYLDERSLQPGQIGWFVIQIDHPDKIAAVSSAIDQKFANTQAETKTTTEKEFASSFISMYGNLNLLLGSIAVAVVITTLFVAGNTMAMAVRERTTEIAVMRTLGFSARAIFSFVAGEALLMSVLGGLVGAGLALVVVQGDRLGLSGGFIPVFGVTPVNAAIGVGLSALIGILAGLVPAMMAARLKIVDALRRVA
jgi:putative ABC transport system permease protein